MAEYWVSVACSFITQIKADSEKEALEKAEKLYRYGKGRLPREYVEVYIEDIDFTQVED